MKNEKGSLSEVVNRLNSVCKLIEATEKAVSISAQERVTRLNRLRSLIKEAQLGLILAELNLVHDTHIQSAVAEATKAFESLSKHERAKLNALMRNLELLGDMNKAAAKAGVNKELLSKLLSVLAPATISDIRRTAIGNLMRAKLRKGADHLGAKLAAQKLKDYSWRAWWAAERNDKEFFIELGKCLSDKSGKNRSEWTSKMSRDIASIFVVNPNISDKDGVRELKDKFGWNMSQDNFRMWKMRLAVNEFLRKQDMLSRAQRSRKA
jgi:hypothetical protein